MEKSSYSINTVWLNCTSKHLDLKCGDILLIIRLPFRGELKYKINVQSALRRISHHEVLSVQFLTRLRSSFQLWETLSKPQPAADRMFYKKSFEPSGLWRPSAAGHDECGVEEEATFTVAATV